MVTCMSLGAPSFPTSQPVSWKVGTSAKQVIVKVRPMRVLLAPSSCKNTNKKLSIVPNPYPNNVACSRKSTMCQLLNMACSFSEKEGSSPEGQGMSTCVLPPPPWAFAGARWWWLPAAEWGCCPLLNNCSCSWDLSPLPSSSDWVRESCEWEDPSSLQLSSTFSCSPSWTLSKVRCSRHSFASCLLAAHFFCLDLLAPWNPFRT
mmetsp:Transcript_18625/g.52357  ORF Transcript_18625/g.52357 Transcript_18625/m.52357 type:complete len:204 (-) Transcript_18625:878-1489(-)